MLPQWRSPLTTVDESTSKSRAATQCPCANGYADRIHRHGDKFTSAEVLDRVLGETVTVQPFVSYLKREVVEPVRRFPFRRPRVPVCDPERVAR